MNAKGATLQKQSTYLLQRLNAIGESRHGRGDRATHSSALWEKREAYLRDWQSFADREDLAETKINRQWSEENFNRFLEQRLSGLAVGSREDYIAGWSSMLQGLEMRGISVPMDAQAYCAERVDFEKAEAQTRGESTTSLPLKISPLSEPSGPLERPGSALLRDVQLATGLRVSEAYKLASEPDRYLHGTLMEGLRGKGGQFYEPRVIEPELVSRLHGRDYSLPSLSTYRRDLDGLHCRPHDLRAFFVQKTYEQMLDRGLSRQEALAGIADLINHHRAEITVYYLGKF